MPEKHNGADHDPSLTGTLAALDRLARADRAEPDDGFEARIVSAARPAVVASIRRERANQMRFAWWGLPIAAAAAVALYFALPTPTAPPRSGGPEITLASVESDLEAFLFIDQLAESASILSESGSAPGSEDAPADELIFDLLTGEGSAL